MGYRHIDNLYKSQDILLFRECYALEKIHGTSAHISWRGGALEKIHGTSAHISWRGGALHFSSGGEKHERFVGLFDKAALSAAFAGLGHDSVIVFGEAYGGKQQGQSWRYGPALRFVAFEVQIGDTWLSVPQAVDVVEKLGLEFVYYVKVSTDLAALDAERDAPSTQAKRNGVEGDHPREGVVLRPLIELVKNNGERIAAKHKRDEERETRTPRKVVDPATMAVLTKAEDIAQEWVTPTRLQHVLDKMPGAGMENTKDVIASMIEDVMREGVGEVVDSREARAAIGRRTAVLFKERLKAALRALES